MSARLRTRQPASTYRLQLNADFTLHDAAAVVPYLATLGVTHLYLSPILEAAPGSTHGYDVVDHSAIATVLGGAAAMQALHEQAAAHQLGLVLDLVPNHMAMPTPAWRNPALWSVLAEGPDSAFAPWFDVDWTAGDGALLMPILGRRMGQVLAAGEIRLDRLPVAGVEQPVLRYFDHVFPVRKGTGHLPLVELVDRQFYRLAYWKVADEELNYRRFFDIDTLAAIRVEEAEVFDPTHAVIVDLVADGVVDGLRIDHPDGLADPAAYLQRLHDATAGVWTTVEKILAPEETLPDAWRCAGSTGYDALWRIQGIFVDPAGATELAGLMHTLTGDTGTDLPRLVDQAKREVIAGSLYTEVNRLADLAASICKADIRLRDHTWRALHDVFVELLVAIDRYRCYVVPGENPSPAALRAFEQGSSTAAERLADERLATLELVSDLLLGREAGSAGKTHDESRAELMIRFQQTSGAVMAKGVEDTAFYRWTHLCSLCEVGRAPERFGISTEELHHWASDLQRRAPLSMTTLSTHDTKRNEDVRVRINVLSEAAGDWHRCVELLRAATLARRPALLDGRTENLLWQTLAGTWTDAGPLPAERLGDYLVKAMREAKTLTRWTEPQLEYESAVIAFANEVIRDPEVARLFGLWRQRVSEGVRAAMLGGKLLQLTMPGVADVYQGSELAAVALVDPDNRRPVDYGDLQQRLAWLDEGHAPRGLDDEKLLVTSRALRARRDHADAFIGDTAGYESLPCSTDNAFAFARTADGQPQVLAVATRLALSLKRYGGWQAHSVVLPPERQWRCLLSQRRFDSGSQALGTVLDTLPVALLVAHD